MICLFARVTVRPTYHSSESTGTFFKPVGPGVRPLTRSSRVTETVGTLKLKKNPQTADILPSWKKDARRSRYALRVSLSTPRLKRGPLARANVKGM